MWIDLALPHRLFLLVHLCGVESPSLRVTAMVSQLNHIHVGYFDAASPTPRKQQLDLLDPLEYPTEEMLDRAASTRAGTKALRDALLCSDRELIQQQVCLSSSVLFLSFPRSISCWVERGRFGSDYVGMCVVR